MKFHSFHLFVSIACLAYLVCAQTSPAVASAEDHVPEALTVSKNWLAQIDAGQYDESYSFGCGAMHDKVPQDRWEVVLKALRAPWGPVLNRTQTKHVYMPNGFEGTEGEFLIVTYDSTFKKADGITEVVVLKWEDGNWRGAGYNAGPKPTAADESAPETAPNATTETQTQDHVKPQAQPQ
jgi:hypothetical protein